jgi:hypothetical protein
MVAHACFWFSWYPVPWIFGVEQGMRSYGYPGSVASQPVPLSSRSLAHASCLSTTSDQAVRSPSALLRASASAAALPTNCPAALPNASAVNEPSHIFRAASISTSQQGLQQQSFSLISCCMRSGGHCTNDPSSLRTLHTPIGLQYLIQVCEWPHRRYVILTSKHISMVEYGRISEDWSWVLNYDVL